MTMGIDQDQISQMLLELQQMDPADVQGLIQELDQESEGLSDGHLVNYAEECVRHTYDTTRERREKWDRLWESHQNTIREYANKEDWQNAMVLNRPFTTTIQAKSIVRRALIERPDYFNLEAVAKDDQEQKLKASFWEKCLRYWLATKDAHMPSIFADAAEMGFVTGTSMGVKVLWRPDQNGVFRLQLDNIGPWNLFADPDRLPRKPQSGLYMIHQEYVPMDELYAMEEQGYYENVDQVGSGKHYTDAAGYTIEDHEESQRRKGQRLHRMRYRKYALVNEFWGGVLNEGGRLVLPNTRYTIANGVVIRRPKRVPFPRLRWPIMQWAPIPHLLRFDGIGLFEGVMSLWHFQNNLLNIYGDNESWRTQAMYELEPSMLEDPHDREIYPGKVWQRKRGADARRAALTPVDKPPSNLQDTQFMWELAQRQWEEGSFVTDPLKGISSQQEQTLGQSEMKLTASQGVFDSIGQDCEAGGVDIIGACMEVTQTFWDPSDTPSMPAILGKNSQELAMMELSGFLMPEARMQSMAVNADIKVTGISRVLERTQVLEKLKFWVLTSADPRYAPYCKDLDTIQRLAAELRLEELLLSEEEIVKAQQQAMLQDSVDRAVQTVDPNHGRPPAKPAAGAPKPGQPAQPPNYKGAV